MTAEPRARHTIAHQPGLDGLRGLAVVVVVVFHAGPPSWMPGGFLGVSTFFTLSGFLIGSLVLVEVSGAGRLDLGRFWARRVRRLLPALLLATFAIAVMARTIDVAAATRADLLGGLTYSTNWVQLAAGRSYGDLFQAPSPATHLWSLAIEEQFYALFPLAVWALARRGGARAGVLWGGAAAFVAGTSYAWAVHDPDVAYLSTFARVPEIAAGLVLAALVRPRVEGEGAQGVGSRTGSRIVTPAVATAGVVALVVGGLAVCRTTLADEWIGSGGLAGFSLVSVVLVLASMRPGPVRWLLRLAPLRWLGLLSYGLYLFHWPVVVLLGRPRVDLAPGPLFVLRVVVSVAVATASYLLVEQPIRHGRMPSLMTSSAALRYGGAALAVAITAVALTLPRSRVSDHPRLAAPAVVPGTASGTDAPPSTVGSGPRPPVVVVLGDSVPNWLVRDGGHALDPAEVSLVDGTSEGCDGAEGSPTGRAGTGTVVTLPPTCTGWRTQYPPVFAGRDVEVAALVVGTGAVLDRKLDGSFHGPCDPVARDWYRADVEARLTYLHDHADRVALVLPAWAEDWSGWVNPSDHVARTDCVRTTLRAAAAAVGKVTVVDLADELCPQGRDACQPVRETDGVHIDPDDAPEVLRWLVTRLLA